MNAKYYLVIIFAIFLFISAVSIRYIFKPAQIVSEYQDGSIVIESAAPISIQGALLTVDSWKQYPEYNIALGVVAGFSWIGAIFCCVGIDNIARMEKRECEDT